LWLAAAGLVLLVAPWLFLHWARVPDDVPPVVKPVVALVGTIFMGGWPVLLVPVLSLAGAGILATLLMHLCSDFFVIDPQNSLLDHPANPRSRDALRVVVTPGNRRGR
jgi:hypothetical protein